MTDRAAAAPPVLRRLLAMVYEGVLLFGVVMLAGLLYAALTQQRHALQGQVGLKLMLVLVLGLYFVGFWCRNGQTLAMKTWHIRLVGPDGGHPSPMRSLARYALAWLWFVPALAIAGAVGLSSSAEILGAVCAGVFAYAGLTRLHPSRQFFHDILCGTRLVDTRPVTGAGASGGLGHNPAP